MKKKFYITTTLPYVNAKPHIGFALEIVEADVISRFHKNILGEDVVFNTGTDEHGQKIYENAIEAGKDPQTYCDENAAKFNQLKESLNLGYTNFIRTTDEKHKKSAQKFWLLCEKDIEKKMYKVKYCVGCELEKTDSELVDGKCPLHPKQNLETREEENYFFKFSRYQKPLLDFYKKNPDFVIPNIRFNEIKRFVEDGLQDFSISRLKNKMPWGVEVPNDKDHVMYVWFDALINYISTLGWPDDQTNFNSYWPGIQVAGKDNLRQQSAMWQAMLMSAGLPNSQQIFIHGFITSEGQKMSKSLGNVIDPIDLVKQYGTDAVRYYLLREIPSYEDGDFSADRMQDIYNADLANELGNLVSRVTTLAAKDAVSYENGNDYFFPEELKSLIGSYQFNLALEYIWNKIKKLNKDVNDFEPWSKTKADRQEFLLKAVKTINEIAYYLSPFMPGTAETITKTTNGAVTKAAPLFPRI